jgi:hypothetical protein
MDAEPRYEDHPACFREETGYFWDEHDVRQNTYWNLMEGVCGNTYGNHCIWSFTTSTSPRFRYHWKDALNHPGAVHAHYAKHLRLSRPYFEFRHAPCLAADDAAAMAHISAGRGNSYAFIYTPQGLPIRARLGELGAEIMRMSWFNPRTGAEDVFGIAGPSETLFVPPSSGKGNDWVLIADAVILN